MATASNQHDSPAPGRGCLISTLATLILLSLSPGVDAQNPIYPISRASSPDVIELEIVDRYQVPIPAAEAFLGTPSDLSNPADATQQAAGVQGQHDVVTGSDGLLRFPFERNIPAFVHVRRSGYAGDVYYWLFAGWRYRGTLPIGSTAYFTCLDDKGHAVDDARLEVRYRYSSGDPTLTCGSGAIHSDADGRTALKFLRNGQYSILAHSPTAGIGYETFQVSNQFGHEDTVALRKDLHFSNDLFGPVLKVFDAEGQPVKPTSVSVYVYADGTTREPAAQIQDNRVTIEPFAAQRTGTIVISAPGFLRSKVSVSVSAGAMQDISLDRDICDDLDLELPKAYIDCAVLVPSSMRAESPWQSATTTGPGTFHFTQVPKSFAVFGVVKRGVHIVGYVERDQSNHANFLAAGELHITYRIEDHPVISGIIRVSTEPSRMDRVAPNILALNRPVCVTDPDGTLRVQGLCPGDYRLEAHMHQIVSDDVLTSLSVHSDAVTDRAIIPRRGESLRGVITRKSTHTIVPFGFVTYAAANFNFHAALVAVSEHGTFTVSGLPSGGDLILTYHAVSWFDDWTPYHWSVGTNEQHTVQASVRLPQTKEVTIEVPDELLNER